MASEPLVSVIIPTFNSEEFLEQCLKSIKTQTHRNTEIIVVDNCSRDKTEVTAKKYGALFVDVRAKRSEARNIGARSSGGKMLLFLDSDMELAHGVVQDCVEKVQGGFSAVIIPEISIGIGFWANCMALEKSCYFDDDTIEAPRFFRKSVVESLGGYDPKLEAGEDWDISQRVEMAGYRIGRVKSFIKHNDGRLTLQNIVRKKYHYGRTLERYESKHPLAARQQLKLIRPAFIKNWRKMARDPAHAMGIALMKACEFIAIKMGDIDENDSPKNSLVEEHTQNHVVNPARGELDLDAGCRL